MCVHKAEKADLCEKVKTILLNTTFSFCYDLYVSHTTWIAHKSTITVLTSNHLLLLFFALCLYAGWILSRWARGGLRLLPSAVLAGRTHRGCGCDRHLAHLCVLRLLVLPPRIRLSVSGLLLCSQVSAITFPRTCLRDVRRWWGGREATHMDTVRAHAW